MTILEIRGLYKRYATPAVVDLDLDVGAGEVHALVGANGAGKSTLAKIIAGLVVRDAGRVRLAGVEFAPRSKADGERSGVHIVQQELTLVPTLSVAENLFLDQLPRRFGFIDYARLHRDARAALATVGLDEVDPASPAGELGVGRRQLVEIAAALARPCRLLILDEPTAALTDPEIALLFAQIERLRRDGVAVMYISHRIDEIRRIADRVSVLRDGRLVETAAAADLPIDRAIQLMTGRGRPETADARQREIGGPVLRVDALRCGSILRDVSFEVCSGEILGVAGLVGSGRTTLLRAIFGADAVDGGRVFLDGRAVHVGNPQDSVRAGIGLVPEDRRGQGVLLPQPVRVNMTLARIDAATSRRGWIDPARERRTSERLRRELDIRCVSVEQPIEELSGGNQQKTVIARWLLRGCRVLLLDEPTRGIDVGAKQTIYGILHGIAGEGRALVVVSSELEELIALCDRIIVLSAGRLVATFQRGNWTEEEIMAAAFSEHANSLRSEPRSRTS